MRNEKPKSRHEPAKKEGRKIISFAKVAFIRRLAASRRRSQSQKRFNLLSATVMRLKLPFRWEQEDCEMVKWGGGCSEIGRRMPRTCHAPAPTPAAAAPDDAVSDGLATH